MSTSVENNEFFGYKKVEKGERQPKGIKII